MDDESLDGYCGAAPDAAQKVAEQRRVRRLTDDELAAMDSSEARAERTRRLISLDGDIGRRRPR